MKERKINLKQLKTKIYLGKIVVDWENNIGTKVDFVYDDINGYVTILEYNKHKNTIKIKYNNEILDISTSSFKKCSIGKILNKRSKNFKYEIGQRIVDDKRDITIID